MAAHVAAITPALEGYRDFVRALDKAGEQPTVQALQAHITLLQHRLDLTATAQAALSALNANGFDTIPDLLLEPDQFDILKDNEATIEAAVARTKSLPPPAVGGSFTLSAGVPKAPPIET